MTLSTASLFALTQGTQPAGGQSGTRTGTVSGSKHGDGTFATTFEEVNGQRTIDKTVTFADGTQKSVERVITMNADGSKSITKTGKNGKTTTITESQTKNDDGTISIAKEVTNSKGETTEISGTISKSHGETDKSFTYTNADGQTETIDRQSVKDGNVRTHTTTGTGYDGSAIYNESTWTTFA